MSQSNAPRLFVTADLPGEIPLDQAQTNYLRNVMRRGPGDAIKVFNGRDGEFHAVIERLAKKDGRAVAQKRLRPQTPAPTLTLGCAPLKQARLDYMVEKAAEMGAEVLWMQPGAESPNAIRRARQLGREVIAGGPCVLVELARR